MVTIEVASKSYGNNGQYIAQIVGRDPKFTFKREFMGKKNGNTTIGYIDEPGLYEDCDLDRKGRKEVGYVAVITRPADCPPLNASGDARLMKVRVTEAEAVTIAKRLDYRESIVEVIAVSLSADGTQYEHEIRTKAEARTASAAVTVDAAAEACWNILQALPEKEARKVLATLKARVTPPKPAAERAATETSVEAEAKA